MNYFVKSKKIHLELLKSGLLKYMYCTTKLSKSSTFDHLTRSSSGLKSLKTGCRVFEKHYSSSFIYTWYTVKIQTEVGREFMLFLVNYTTNWNGVL